MAAWRVGGRIGPWFGDSKRAITAISHSILIAAWWMLTNNCDYADLGADFYDRYTNPEAQTRRLVRQLQALGHTVTLDDAA